MPYYYRRRSRWPYRSWRRSSLARSQTQGTRRFSVSIPVEGYTSVPVASGQRNSYSIVFQPWYTSNSVAPIADLWAKYGNVVNNAVYQIYTRLYDEVKVDGCSLLIAVQGLPSTVNGFKCVSAVDRHYALADIPTQQSVATLMGAPESMSKTFTSLNNAKIYRSVWARDLGERTTFADATLGTKDIPATQATAAYQQAGLQEFLENGTYQVFCPGITVGFELGASPQADSNVEIQYKIVWRFTFRNPKYGGGTLSRSFEKFAETRADVVSAMKSDEMEETPVVKKKKKVVYEEEVIPDDEKEEDDDELNPMLDESQEPFTAPKPVLMKKGGKKG